MVTPVDESPGVTTASAVYSEETGEKEAKEPPSPVPSLSRGDNGNLLSSLELLPFGIVLPPLLVFLSR